MERKPVKSPGQQIRESATAAAADRQKSTDSVEPAALAPSGATMLNLVLADDPFGGIPLGRVINIIGDSSSGKTLLAMTALAEMANDPRWDDYRLILDDAEDAFSFNTAYLFGQKLVDRLDRSIRSDTVESFYGSIKKVINEGKPFVYILDSLDALSSADELKRADTYADGKEVGGSYKMEKPKLISELLRVVTGDVDSTKSIVIILSQTRENLDPMSYQKKVRSGGKALKFYCSHEIWLTRGQRLKSKERVIGVESHVKCTKNKQTGKERECKFTIYYDYGVDDIGSCIDFLVAEGFWSKSGQKIQTPFEIDGELLVGTRDRIIRTVEQHKLEKELKTMVGNAWLDIENDLKSNRKRRFD